RFFEGLRSSGEWDALRAEQQRKWMWREVSHLLVAALERNPDVRSFARALEADVLRGTAAPGAAAELIVDRFLSSRQGSCE
ncbi:hypothetical protein IWQ57_001233, partial [Coemansia nantahalensis]